MSLENDHLNLFSILSYINTINNVDYYLFYWTIWQRKVYWAIFTNVTCVHYKPYKEVIFFLPCQTFREATVPVHFPSFSSRLYLMRLLLRITGFFYPGSVIFPMALKTRCALTFQQHDQYFSNFTKPRIIVTLFFRTFDFFQLLLVFWKNIRLFL